MSWSSQKKKEDFFVPFILSEGTFVTFVFYETFVFYLNI